jgi:hypothetical protein
MSHCGVVRASSWGDLFDCAYRWYWKNIEGVRGPTRSAMVAGSAVHKGTDVYDREIMDGFAGSVNAAVEAASAYASAPTNEDGSAQEVDWSDDEGMSRGETVDMAVKLTAKYCQVVAPAMKYDAIEVKCNALDVTTEAGTVRLTGTTDRVRVYDNGSKGIQDFKTGGKAVEGITSGQPRAVTKGHHLQVGAYTLMTEQETAQRLTGPGAILGFQTNSKLHIAEGRIDEPKRALIGRDGQPGLIEIAAGMLTSGIFPPNPKSVLCSRKWCPAYDRCAYHE